MNTNLLRGLFMLLFASAWTLGCVSQDEDDPDVVDTGSDPGETDTAGTDTESEPVETDDYWINGYCAGWDPDTGADASSSTCGNVNDVGCCTGNAVLWCEDGVLKCYECPSTEFCGYDPDSMYYACFETDYGPDATGDNPMECVAP